MIEQGADINTKDSSGRTPLFERAGWKDGNIESLLELGADVNISDKYGNTPLHSAASSFATDSAKKLIDFGANLKAQNNDSLNSLEYALKLCQNAKIEDALELSKVFLKIGLKPSPNMRKFIQDIGESFEFYRLRFNKDKVNQVSDALNELYKLFNVIPVERRVMHDGQAPISINSSSWQEQHEELWNYLVPSNGPAQTIQGELIRVSGRISNELNGNGGINWMMTIK